MVVCSLNCIMNLWYQANYSSAQHSSSKGRIILISIFYLAVLVVTTTITFQRQSSCFVGGLQVFSFHTSPIANTFFGAARGTQREHHYLSSLAQQHNIIRRKVHQIAPSPNRQLINQYKMSTSNSNIQQDQGQQELWMRSPMEKHGKRIPTASLKTVIITTAFIPVWAVTVLPFSILYQTSKLIVNKMKETMSPTPSPLLAKTLQSIDSGYVVDPKAIIPLPDRKYDIVILGVTGFTGYLAARHLLKTYGVNGAVKWAIAGRSQSKLNDVKERLRLEISDSDNGSMDDISQLETIVVDTSIPSTLPKLVSQTRVVATTAGPYVLYGNHVIEFCVKYGTHYVDITGEVDWIKTMITKWQTTCQVTGAKIIPFCGHDCVPWDISAMKLQEILMEEQKDTVQSITFYDEMIGAAPGGTYATVMNAIEGGGDSTKSSPQLRADFDPFLRLPNDMKSTNICKSAISLIPQKVNPPKWVSPSDDATSSKWTTPFIMAMVNAQVVRWTYALRAATSAAASPMETNMTYNEATLHPNFQTAYVMYVGTIMFGSMLFNPITKYILKQYVLPKPGEGPTMKDMEQKHYLCVRGVALGVNGSRAESIFYLNHDAGCLETSKMMIESGLCLALQDAELPSTHKGGFMSPATGLGDVLLHRLMNVGVYFESKSFPAPHKQSKL